MSFSTDLKESITFWISTETPLERGKNWNFIMINYYDVS